MDEHQWLAERFEDLHPAVVNGAAGVVVTVRGRPVAVMGFTVANGRIAEIDDPERVHRVAAAVVTGPRRRRP